MDHLILWTLPGRASDKLGYGFNSFSGKYCNTQVASFGDELKEEESIVLPPKAVQKALHVQRLYDIIEPLILSPGAILTGESDATVTDKSGVKALNKLYGLLSKNSVNFLVYNVVLAETVVRGDINYGDHYQSGTVKAFKQCLIIAGCPTEEGSDREFWEWSQKNIDAAVRKISRIPDTATSEHKWTAGKWTYIEISIGSNNTIAEATDAQMITNLDTFSRFQVPVDMEDNRMQDFAVLTPYMEVPAFKKDRGNIPPLQYSGAYRYASQLLEDLIQYKALEDEINSIITNLNAHNVNYDPSTAKVTLAEIASKITSATSGGKQLAPKNVVEAFLVLDGAPVTRHLPFRPTVKSLTEAGEECRTELKRITGEFNQLKDNPGSAERLADSAQFHSASDLRRRLPKKGEQFPFRTFDDDEIPPKSLKDIQEIEKGEKKNSFCMTEFVGDHSPHEPPALFSCWTQCSTATSITRVTIGWQNGYVCKILLTYSDILDPKTEPVEFPISSNYSGDIQRVNDFRLDRDDRIYRVNFYTYKVPQFGVKVITGFQFVTRAGKIADMVSNEPKYNVMEMTTSAVDSRWSFKGFWGQSGDAFDKMGAFYGMDAEPPDMSIRKQPVQFDLSAR